MWHIHIQTAQTVFYIVRRANFTLLCLMPLQLPPLMCTYMNLNTFCKIMQ